MKASRGGLAEGAARLTSRDGRYRPEADFAMVRFRLRLTALIGSTTQPAKT